MSPKYVKSFALLANILYCDTEIEENGKCGGIEK